MIVSGCAVWPVLLRVLRVLRVLCVLRSLIESLCFCDAVCPSFCVCVCVPINTPYLAFETFDSFTAAYCVFYFGAFILYGFSLQRAASCAASGVCIFVVFLNHGWLLA